MKLTNESINQSFDNEDILDAYSNLSEPINKSVTWSEKIRTKKNFDKKTLEIERQIKNFQIRRLFYNVFIIASAIFIALFLVDNLAAQNLTGLKYLSLEIKLLILLPIIISFFIILDFKRQIYSLNQCLSSLKEYQFKQDIQEPQIEKSSKKESFMSQVRKIKIDAPADFSTNYEKYM